MARSAKKAAVSPAPQAPQIERPPQPERYKASKDELLKLYREMLLIRRFEERAGQLYGLGLIGGFCHLYIGQEAVARRASVGDDRRQGQRHHRLSRSRPHARLRHRSQGHHGRADRPRRRHLQGQGRVDAHVQRRPWLLRRPRHRRRAGAARHGPRLQAQICEDGGVCLTYLGDGAVNQGQVYEAFNMAKLWDLPVIYAIENNQYAMGTSIKRSSAEPLLYRRGEAHRIPGLQVDGMDVLAVRGAAEVALEWTRSGKGPIIIEFMTYRYRGHSMSDPAKYRTREEVQDVREHRDPITHAERDLEAMGVKEEELKAIDKEIKDIVVEAAKFAEDAPEPAPAELYTDVLVGSY